MDNRLPGKLPELTASAIELWIYGGEATLRARAAPQRALSPVLALRIDAHAQEYVKGDHHWRPNPLPDFGAVRCASRTFTSTHSLRFRCEEEFVLVNIVRNNKHVRGLSGAVAAPVASEGNE